MRIAGLDNSTKRIGYADADGGIHSISVHAGAEDKPRRLHQLATALTLDLRRHPPLPDLIIVEGYAPSPFPWSMIRLGELGGVVRLRLFEMDIPFVEIPPKSVKLFATGNGNAGKPAMIAAAEALDALVRNDDEADAFHLRRFGLCATGTIPTEHEHEYKAIRDCGVQFR